MTNCAEEQRVTVFDSLGWSAGVMESKHSEPQASTEPPWRYRFTDETLVEEIGSHVRIYGRWDWQFGAWDIDFAAGSYTEVIPSWPILKPSGAWRSPDAIRGPEGYPSDPMWRIEADAPYAALFSCIPTHVRRLVAPLGNFQWIGLGMIWRDPEVAYLLDELVATGRIEELTEVWETKKTLTQTPCLSEITEAALRSVKGFA